MTNNYIREIAGKIRGRVDPALLPQGDLDLLFDLYAVLVLVKGEAVTGRDVHNAWAAWMTHEDPAHESIQPFEMLSASTQSEDGPFVEAIRNVAQSRPT